MDKPISGTRKEILMLLKKRGRVTVDDLAASLELTGVAVRHHLSALKADGHVCSETERQSRGRPHELYSLTSEADEKLFPRTYEVMLEDLLEDLSASGGGKKVEQFFMRQKERMLEKYAPRVAGKNLRERVAEVTLILEEQGFMAEWQESSDGMFILTEHNCTISKVAERFSQSCYCELELIGDLVEANVERIEHRVAGDQRCAYAIKAKRKKRAMAGKK